MKLEKNAFTLIELMVVITIMFILSMMMYAPYQHYQTKQKVRNSAKIVTQTLYESRNLAINGSLTGTWNASIWVLFASGAEDIWIFQYPFWENTWTYSDKTDKNGSYFYENKKLEPGVKITWKDYLIIYEAISGSWRYLENKIDFTPDAHKRLELNIWFKGTTSWNLTKKIFYYIYTYVADIQ